MLKLEEMSRARKTMLAVEIIVRALLLVAILPFSAFFLVIAPDIVLTPLMILLMLIVGFPYGVYGRQIWKWQALALLIIVISIVIGSTMRIDSLQLPH